MSIYFTNLGQTTDFPASNPDIGSGANATSYSNSSWTPPTYGLIFVFVGSRDNDGGTNTIPTMSGNNLTWTNIASIDVSGSRRLTLFGADAAGSTTGSTTVDFGATTQDSCMAMFAYAADADLSGGVAATFVQAPTNSGTSTTPNVTLSAAGNSANRPIFAFAINPNATVTGSTPATGWLELDDVTFGTHDGTTVLIETQCKTDSFDTSAGATQSNNVAWSAIAAEIKAREVKGDFLKMF